VVEPLAPQFGHFVLRQNFFIAELGRPFESVIVDSSIFPGVRLSICGTRWYVTFVDWPASGSVSSTNAINETKMRWSFLDLHSACSALYEGANECQDRVFPPGTGGVAAPVRKSAKPPKRRRRVVIMVNVDL